MVGDDARLAGDRGRFDVGAIHQLAEVIQGRGESVLIGFRPRFRERDEVIERAVQDSLDSAVFGVPDDVKANLSPGSLKDITNGNSIYAIPDDGGPVAMMYRKDVFDKYGLTPPTTWDEYAADAQKFFGWAAALKNDNAQKEYYLTDVPSIARTAARRPARLRRKTKRMS